MSYQYINTETRDRVGIITLDRPDAMNALSDALMHEVGQALEAFDGDDAIGAVVLTGSAKAFAAGADIKDMAKSDFVDLFRRDFPGADGWAAPDSFRKPLIAAVAGYALGGGCELAMACDFIIAADNAQFGQPEVKIGAMPGAGGTQRLTRAVGKAKAMEMCLTGRMMDAEEAERSGLVARVVPADRLLEDALATAARIAGHSLPSTMLIKEAVDQAFETPLRDGLRQERRLFQSTFATEDQKEGMAAFVEKRKPDFRHR
ncbi:enoyl-CoA hydratase [Arhodomonas sp. AD133]|uniref:enoyl-CoA hydratase n=1 Tax=Arhodomonas sp. AD133 TaxID=3415009 RepID=UPI003EC1300D